MQFNPLFLNDTGNTQTLVSKNNKMQSNKYLFSDIVKVVMQDDNGNRKLKNISIDEKTNSELNPLANMDLVTEELQTKIITNSENELMKLQLADILPGDMADLLVNENATISDEKAISFIGKEQLEGELKNFITGLVGEKIIESNVSNTKGLLLRLEDHKSAVNIEVTKELNPKLSSDKIVVQALVVPEKSKIQSLTKVNELLPLGSTKQTLQSAKIKVEQSQLVPKTESNLLNTVKQKQTVQGTEKQILLEQSEVKQVTTTKPTLSVFSFNTKIENNENNISISSNKQVFHNLNKANVLNVEQSLKIKGDVALSKPNGNIVSNEKLQEPKASTEINKETNKEIKPQSKSILNSNLEIPKDNAKGKDYNVSQITIVKKQPISLDEMKTTINVENKRVDAVLRKIDFNLVGKSQIKNTSNQKQNVEEKIQNEKKITNTQKQTSEIEIQNNKKFVNENDIKQTKSMQKNNTEEKPNIKSEIIIDEIKIEKIDVKVSKNKIQNIVNTKKEIEQPKTAQKENIDEKTNSKVETRTDEIKFDKVDVKTPSDKHQNITNKKEIVKEELKTEEKNIELPKTAVSKGDVPIAKPNKKVSVKVKKGLKLVRRIVPTSVKTEQEIVSVNNLNNQNRSEFDTNPDLNSSNHSQSILNTENNLEIKNKPLAAFQNKLNGELVNVKEEASILSQEVRQQNSERIVKSIEVIKEISRFISKQEKGTLSFRISPEHLGELKIILETSEQKLLANIQVENEQAKQLVEKNINDLQNQLKENGVELSSLNISLRNPKSNKEEMSDQGSGNSRSSEELNVEEIKEEKINRSLGYNTYEYLA